jgi:hypothetical protein
LLNLRTEIILKDANDVAFWFSFSFPIAVFWEQRTGKPDFSLIHQTLVSSALFPKKRKYGEWIKSGEDESSGRD